VEVEYELADPEFRRGVEALRWIEELPLLQVDARVIGLAELLMKERVMPGPVAGDAVHVAIAAVHGLDYMLTWNVRRLANPEPREPKQDRSPAGDLPSRRVVAAADCHAGLPLGART